MLKLLNKIKEAVMYYLFGDIEWIDESLILTTSHRDILKLNVTGFDHDEIMRSKCGRYILLIKRMSYEVVLIDLNAVYWRHCVSYYLGRVKNPTVINLDVMDLVRYTHFLNEEEINLFDPRVDIDYFKPFEVVDGIVKVNGAVYERKGYPSVRHGILEEDLDYFFN